ncbi:hypothetical protein L1049_021867 [Liquidambar formosana]|uniref:Uncharacterized protein n=1 Tax=Liquidambar formosana TaxID=63359 RepID=A0AAP0RBK0_LIQFO
MTRTKKISDLRMSGIFGCTIPMNNRFANPVKEAMISSASPANQCRIFRSTSLVSFVPKKHGVANPFKQPFIVSSASPFNSQLPRSPHDSTSPPFDRQLPPLPNYPISPPVGHASFVKFTWDEKDLASEESLRDLYERWMIYHKVSRSGEEKEKRFKVFKDTGFLEVVRRRKSVSKCLRIRRNTFWIITRKGILPIWR